MVISHFFCYNVYTGDIMVLVTEKDNYTFDDCNSKMYELRTDDLIVDFFQSGNRDLYFLCIPREDKKENILEIDAIDNYQLYKAVDELYKDITDLNRWGQRKEYLKEYQSKLFNGEHISWESDDCCDPNIEDKKYNYLNIYQEENKYIFKFINNSDRPMFSISFNTDRSKYRTFAFAFVTFLSNLSNVTEKYQQIEIEEYMIKKLRKENKNG